MARDQYKYFRVEANEIVEDLAKGLIDLERRADPELVARLLRQAHTLKGAARIVRHRELADLAHAMEDALAPLRDAPVAQRLDDALALVDRMQAQLHTLTSPITDEPAAKRAEEMPLLVRAEMAAIDDALAGLAAVQVLLARSRATPDRHAGVRHLEHAERELREVRKDVEQLRLAAAGAIFTSLERTARDAAIANGKHVAFIGRGSDVRVDGQVLSAVHGAVIQLVRNAVVHGLEPAAERTAAGKSAEGQIVVAVSTLGRSLSITCEDDGRGLDLAAIRRAAQKRGIASNLLNDPSNAFELLLQGGISTARDVSELAGRGIGLDIVRDATQRLGGTVTVRTTPGRGTAITMVVPVSVSALTLVRVDTGGRVVAVPQAAVRRVVRFRAEDLVSTGDRTTLALADTLVPWASLASVLEISADDPRTAVLIEAGDAIAALGVERVLGIEDAVVRAAPTDAPIDPIVSGIALDAEGHPYAVLDPAVLVDAAQRARAVTAKHRTPVSPILVVDDSLTTRMLEQSILESAGYDVELASSAEDALDKLAHSTYALLLVDVEMPGMDGFSLIATMRSRPALAHVPAILVTSRDAAEDRRRGLAVGAQGYVVKGSFDQGELLAMIGKLVRR